MRARPEARAEVARDNQRTLVVQILGGALLDLLATDEEDRVTAAVHRQLALLRG